MILIALIKSVFDFLCNVLLEMYFRIRSSLPPSQPETPDTQAITREAKNVTCVLGSNLFEFACLRKRWLTFYHNGFYYQRWWASSSFGRLFLDPRMETFDPVYFNSRWVDPNGVCSAIRTNSRSDYLATRETAYCIFFSAQNRIYKQTTYAKWSWKLSISI